MPLLLALVLAASPDHGDAAEAPSQAKSASPQVQSAPPAKAEGAPANTQSDADLELELKKALGKDAKQTSVPKEASGPSGSASASDAAASGSAQSTGHSAGSALMHGLQSLNPDISLIVESNAGYIRRAPSFQNGEDPNFRPAPGEHALGLMVQEVELAFSAVVDPYFKAQAYLIVPNLEGIEVEEAFGTTTSLPWNLQVRAGSFRSLFGRQNSQHLHVQDFTRRPLFSAGMLGEDGLRGPAAELSWLAPLPFYLTLWADVHTIRANGPPDPGAGAAPPAVSFGYHGVKEPTLAGGAKAFFDFTEELSFLPSLEFATGVSPGIALGDASVGRGRRAFLVEGEFLLKWTPPNLANGYFSWAWQTEALLRRWEAGDAVADGWDGAFYTQLVARLSRSWKAGVRIEAVGAPSSPVLAPAQRVGLSITFEPSEFARVRAYADLEHSAGLPEAARGSNAFPPVAEWAPAAMLQVELSIGAHGAHSF